MSEVWTFAEQRHSMVNQVSFELLNRGKKLSEKLNSPLASVILGYHIKKESIDELISRGADKVYVVDNKHLANFLVEPYTRILLSLLDEYNPYIFLAAATTLGRTLMPYIAIKKKTGLTADCTILDIEEGTDNLLQTRPAIGGNILAMIKTPDTKPQMATVRPHSTKPATPDKKRKGKVIFRKYDDKNYKSRIKFIEFIKDESQQVAIQDAKIVVSAGRGIGKKGKFKMIDELAEIIGGAVGASRDVVDRGWKTYPHQVGLSGKTISPLLYIANGISGSVQHIAGIQTAENIIAINKEPDAQIFKLADLGIVGDLHEIVPLLIERLREYKLKEAQNEIQ